ncbi:MAG: HAD-IB family hydrolase [Gammaproteobacteria bacterium]|nr:HAD-IB family hydrolase [Gammaproteobacteria bacterium]
MDPHKIKVAFDLDGTLIATDSAQSWLSFLREAGVKGAEQACVHCSEVMQHYQSGGLDMTAYMAAWLQPVAGLPLSSVQQLVAEFVSSDIVPAIYPEALARLQWHQSKGHHIAIVSASPALLVQPIASLFKVDQVMAIEVEISNELITQKAIPPFPFKEGKVLAINQWLYRGSVRQLDYAYSDSINDLPLLEMAKRPFCVNPDPALRDKAERREWPIYQWNLTKVSV